MSMRAFIGIPLPERVTRDIARLQGLCPVGRAVDDETLHLTLVFLGEQSEADLRDLCEDLDRIDVTPMKMCLSGLDVFGGRWGSALALEVQGDSTLTALQGRVERRVRASGITLERRRFRPHVTFMRLGKDPGPAAQAKLQGFISSQGLAFTPKYFTASSFALYRSNLHPNGASYDVLAEFGLGQDFSE